MILKLFCHIECEEHPNYTFLCFGGLGKYTRIWRYVYPKAEVLRVKL